LGKMGRFLGILGIYLKILRFNAKILTLSVLYFYLYHTPVFSVNVPLSQSSCAPPPRKSGEPPYLPIHSPCIER